MLVPFVWCILVVVRAYPNSVICVGVCVNVWDCPLGKSQMEGVSSWIFP